MGKLKKYRILLYEWDCVNGDMLYREERIIEAKNLEHAKKIAWRFIDDLIEGAEEEGWERISETDHSVVLSKNGFENEVGFEISEL